MLRIAFYSLLSDINTMTKRGGGVIFMILLFIGVFLPFIPETEFIVWSWSYFYMTLLYLLAPKTSLDFFVFPLSITDIKKIVYGRILITDILILVLGLLVENISILFGVQQSKLGYLVLIVFMIAYKYINVFRMVGFRKYGHKFKMRDIYGIVILVLALLWACGFFNVIESYLVRLAGVVLCNLLMWPYLWIVNREMDFYDYKEDRNPWSYQKKLR